MFGICLCGGGKHVYKCECRMCCQVGWEALPTERPQFSRKRITHGATFSVPSDPGKQDMEINNSRKRFLELKNGLPAHK